jgi:hydrogenase-4 transcriptional activator
VMERAAILGDGRRLEVAKALGSAPEPGATTAVTAPAAGVFALETLDRATVRHIEAALAQTHGRIEGPFGAARLLGINPHTLRSRMRKLGIDPVPFRSY